MEVINLLEKCSKFVSFPTVIFIDYWHYKCFKKEFSAHI